MRKQKNKLELDIKAFTDFPVFDHWNFNTKKFELIALNNLSIRFNDYLRDEIQELYLMRRATFIIPRWIKKESFLLDYLTEAIVNAAKYAVFGNATYEAEGPNSYGGGDDSIQEQFVVWALDITTDEYRKTRGLAYSENMYESEVIREWLLESELLHYIKTEVLV